MHNTRLHFFCVTMLRCIPAFLLFFFFNDTATTEIYTLSLHDALPISPATRYGNAASCSQPCSPRCHAMAKKKLSGDRKSTRLNSSHSQISYAVFCLKKKNKLNTRISTVAKNSTLLHLYTKSSVEGSVYSDGLITCITHVYTSFVLLC